MRATRVGSAKERFFKRFAVDEKSGCWNWTGPPTPAGYGYIAGAIDGKRHVPKGQKILAHRASWIIHHGEIPAGVGAHGTVVMHKCDNRLCVNPEHLMLGTQSDNVLDMVAKGRSGVRTVYTGLDHWHSSFKSQAEIDLICATAGQTKALAEQFGVTQSTIKRVRRRNGLIALDADKFKNKPLPQAAIDHIRSTKPGTRGLGKLYGVGKTTIANIRKRLTHSG